MFGYCCCGNSNNSDQGERRHVRLKFLRSQLLYDIKNYAFVESDVMDEERQHAKHVLADIGEAGNVDRVSRLLSVIHAAVVEMLYPYTKREPLEEEVDDCLHAPEEYIIEMRVPETMSRTTIQLLSKLIHEYMVYCVLADWLGITNPQAAAKWQAKAEDTKQEIEKAKNARMKAITRKLHPW